MTTAGEGGAITTADADVWRRCWEYKDHGKNHHQAVIEPTHPPGFRWLHDSFGTNARMTEVQAAVGRCQLRKVDGWVATRRAHAAHLSRAYEIWTRCDCPTSRPAWSTPSTATTSTFGPSCSPRMGPQPGRRRARRRRCTRGPRRVLRDPP